MYLIFSIFFRIIILQFYKSFFKKIFLTIIPITIFTDFVFLNDENQIDHEKWYKILKYTIIVLVVGIGSIYFIHYFSNGGDDGFIGFIKSFFMKTYDLSQLSDTRISIGEIRRRDGMHILEVCNKPNKPIHFCSFTKKDLLEMDPETLIAFANHPVLFTKRFDEGVRIYQLVPAKIIIELIDVFFK